MKVLSVVGTRPNFVKLFTVHRALLTAGHHHLIVHTGQHYDVNMSDVFFRDLELPEPDLYLGTEPGPPVIQTAHILDGLQTHLPDLAPDWVVVYGDVTSTPAAALAARLLGFHTAHVESGYRSRDRAMPEEINRVVTDHIADLLLAPDATAAANLRAERVEDARIRIVGSCNIDALMHLQSSSERIALPDGLIPRAFAVLTLHRPGNVDDSARLQRLMAVLGEVAGDIPVLFPLHPRTRARISAAGVRVPNGISVVEPMPYRDFLNVVAAARVVFTDSGGLQEETAFLGVPCVVMRNTSERPGLVASGHTRLVGDDPAAILNAWNKITSESILPEPYRDAWSDGQTGVRIVQALLNAYE